MEEKALPKRKKNRLENYDYSSGGVYFITICTSAKKNYFWGRVGAIIDRPQGMELSRCGEIVKKAIENIPVTYPSVFLESYVVMPNHVHLLMRIGTDDNGRPLVAPTISNIVKQFKGYVTKRAGIAVWQKSFYDHVIRNHQDYKEHLRYIDENPLRWRNDELYVKYTEN